MADPIKILNAVRSPVISGVGAADQIVTAENDQIHQINMDAQLRAVGLTTTATAVPGLGLSAFSANLAAMPIF